MQPSPGKIQSLPIKILYTIDTSPQSYLAILPERQDVYVHPRSLAYGLGSQDELLGSCTLKAVARGICFASPECVPNKSSLDFSVYNLDPSGTIPSAAASSRAFPTPGNGPPSSCWTGKGFLSWSLAEEGFGSTLTRGRLVREFEFSPSRFAEGGEGGLEGLMAAAAAHHHRNEDSCDEVDGKGWGLEVVLTLRQINPEGKSEFADRKQFQDMVSSGGKSVPSKPLVTESSTPIRSDPTTASLPVKSEQPVNHPPATQPPLSSGRRSQSTFPVPSGSPTQSFRHSPREHPHPAGAGSSRPQRVAQVQSHSSDASPATHPTTPPPSIPTVVSNRMRTPPPLSPNRVGLLNLLRSEAKMSPDLARKLVANQHMVRLLKAAQSSTGSDGEVESRRHLSFSGVNPNPRPIDSTDPANVTDFASPIQSSSNSSLDSCCHCSATESDLWMTKRLRDGAHRRVCNACGSYFNKYKRMRPRELWDDADNQNRSTSELNGHIPVRSSPRLNRTLQNDKSASYMATESPRKRQRNRPAPQPSPRMATRASTRTDAEARIATTPTPGETCVAPLEIVSHFPMSPSTAFGSSTVLGSTGNDPFDVESLFADFTDVDAGMTAENNRHDSVSTSLPPADSDTIDLEALFGGEGAASIMQLLASLEGGIDEDGV